MDINSVNFTAQRTHYNIRRLLIGYTDLNTNRLLILLY